MNMNAFNAQMNQFFFWATVAQLVGAAVALWLMYWVTKSAIRDGIKESGLIDALRAPKPPERSLRDVLDNTNDTRPMNDLRAD